MLGRRVPLATLVIVAITATTTALQFVFPALLEIFERRPGALAAHEYWRLITPIFFHPQGWQQIVVDFTALIIVGAIVEGLVGSGRWLMLYFAAGLAGELAGFAWKPLGAGSSVAIAGLVGALAVWLLRNHTIQARLSGMVILAGALLLTAFRDLHGPPLLVGVVLPLLVPARPAIPN